MTEFGALIATLADGEQQQFVLSKTEVSIGRSATSDIRLRDAKVSRSHTRLECGAGGCFVEDLGSANGTRVNRSRVQRARLTPGDVITIGSATLRFAAKASEDDETLIGVGAADGEASEPTLFGGAIETQLNESRVARLAIHNASSTWEATLDGDVLSIGRLPENDVAIDSPRASRRHARIERTAAGYLLRDLNSNNGTTVNGRRVTTHRLEDCDTIRIGGTQMTFKAGFAEEDLTMMDVPRAKANVKRPVVVVPGFMGSNLWMGSEKVWPNARRLFKDPESLKLGAGSPPVVAKGLVNEVVMIPNLIKQEQYGGLIDYLEESLGYERGKDLLEFAYDFRQDVRASARELAQAIAEWNPAGAVTVIAHSMGSLVSRYYVDRLGGHKRTERMILLGGPHSGAPKAVINLSMAATLLPFGLLGTKLRELLLTYPSMYSLLPEYECGSDQTGRSIDWLKDTTWLPEASAPHLKGAAEMRSELYRGCTVPTVCVFGYGMKTMTSLRMQRDERGLCAGVETVHELAGDSTVPENSATIEGAEIHPVRQFHGTLHVDGDVKKRLKVELTR
jgi:pSer/pThr/pTyr-binding forkhead associated (FHA) protein